MDFVDQVYDGPLLEFMDGFVDPVLMEDGAPVHRSLAPKVWRQEHNVTKMVWPAQSPDLNPIENIWMQMKTVIQKNNEGSVTLERLEQMIRDAWDNIPMERINHLVESVPDRVKVLKKNHGKSTRW
jgi:hypothetical protein